MNASMLRLYGVTFATLLLLPANMAHAADEELNLAKELVRLRGEVEDLNGSIEAEKADLNNRLNFYSSQKSDLEAQIQREELRIKQMQAAIARQRELVRNAENAREDLKPALLTAIETIRRYIARSLPFKTAERLAALNELEEKLRNGSLSPQKTAARLWSLIEDELRITRENGLYRQVIKFDGEEVLADVARLGTVMMYFKTSDGRMGMAVHKSDSWSFQQVHDSGDKKRITYLFDSLKKQIRSGFFELPGAGLQ